ncbi:unnamed protein product, partial [marine sediment metagenome]
LQAGITKLVNGAGLFWEKSFLISWTQDLINMISVDLTNFR